MEILPHEYMVAGAKGQIVVYKVVLYLEDGSAPIQDSGIKGRA